MHLVYQKLHEKYGPIIRVGPNVLDIVSPELVKPAFNDIRSEWSKVSDILGMAHEFGAAG